MCCRSWIALIEDVCYSSNFKMGDVLHMISIICLLVKLIKTRSCGGVSGKTVLLFAIDYLARNLDMSFPVSYSSLVNITFMVCYYIVSTIFFVFRNSYRYHEDTFPIELLLIPSLLLAICVGDGVTSVRILKTFSVYLESVTILPQFYMIDKMGEMEKNLLYYLIPLGLCRLFYVIDCIESYATKDHFDVVAHSAGIIYLSVYLLALIIFCVSKIKIVDEENRRVLKSDIFFVSSSEPRREIVDEEKMVIPEQLME